LSVSKDGTVYVSDTHAIYKVSKGKVSVFAGGSSGYKEGQGSAAAFAFPLGLATDDFGNVYVADWTNKAVRKISAGGMVTTVGGKSGEKYLKNLGDLDAVSDGVATDLLVVNQYYFVHKWGVPKVGNPLVSEFLDTKTLAEASLRGVACVQKIANRHCFVAGYGEGRLYEVYFDKAKSTSSVQTWGGKKKSNVDGAISAAQFSAPYGIAVDSSRSIVYISDNASNNLRRFDLVMKEVFTEIAGDSSKLQTAQPEGTTFGGAKLSAVFFEGDSYLDVDEGGAVYIADYPKGENNTHLRKMTPPSTCPGKMQCGDFKGQSICM
jgi:DNA-binding beta-propeller fold protein YncE